MDIIAVGLLVVFIIIFVGGAIFLGISTMKGKD